MRQYSGRTADGNPTALSNAIHNPGRLSKAPICSFMGLRGTVSESLQTRHAGGYGRQKLKAGWWHLLQHMRIFVE